MFVENIEDATQFNHEKSMLSHVQFMTDNKHHPKSVKLDNGMFVCEVIEANHSLPKSVGYWKDSED